MICPDEKTFKIGDFVFAKVRGYPPWPAKITDILNNKKYVVYFYGTGEKGFMRLSELSHYNEKHKQLFVIPKRMKKIQFKRAVRQIEDAIKGIDSGPLNNGIQVLNNLPAKNIQSISNNLHANKNREINNKKGGVASRKINLYTYEDNKFLMNEKQLLLTILNMKSSLTVYNPNIDKCLEYLEPCNYSNVTALMLIKNPHIVDAIRKLLKYQLHSDLRIGDPSWHIKVEKIHNKANIIYNSFKNLFHIPEGTDFEVFFNEECKKFNISTSHFTNFQKIMLVNEKDIPILIED